MNTEKKKTGKLKKIVIAVIGVLIILFVIASFSGGGDEVSKDNAEKTMESNENKESESEPEDTGNGTQENAEDTKTQEASDTRHHIGETVAFQTDNGGEINVTLTEWGPLKDYLGSPIIYIKYTIENTGTETVAVGNGLFDIYADDYSAKTGITVSDENKVGDEIFARDLSAGRKLDGVVYADVNADSVGVIEVECGGSVFVLKDKMAEDASAVGMDKDSLNDVNIPPDMEIFSQPIDASELSGSYGGINDGQSTLSLSIYSSPEEGEAGIGNAEIYVGGGQYSYYGQVAEVTENVYKVATDTGDEVLLNASIAANGIVLELDVNGSLIEEYLMMEHYES